MLASRLGLVSTIAVAAVLLSATSRTAAASSRSATAQGAATAGFTANNSSLVDYDTWLAETSGLASAGFIDTDNDPASLSVKLLWFRPSGGAAEAAALAEASARGINASIVSWPYPQTQMDAGATALWTLIRSSAWSGFQVFGIITLDPAAPGFEIEGDFTGGMGPGERSDHLKAKLESIAALVTAIPVRVLSGVVGGNGAGRTTDTSPFYAGGLMHTDATGICSNSFAVMYQGTVRTMTARHCMATNYYSSAPSGDDMYGPSGVSDAGSQSRMLVGHGTYGAWDGGPMATGVKLVAGLARPGNGIYICTTGGNSGAHCNIQITATVSYNDNYSEINDKQAVQMSTGNGQIAAMQGDSGGGALTLGSDGSQIYAAGMIQGVGHFRGEPFTGPTACGPANAYEANECGRIVVETPMSMILNDYVATLYTGP